MSFPASAIVARIAWRPAWMASGSLLPPISRAMSASLGSASAWARKAGSRLSSAAAARSASTKAASHVTGLPCAGVARRLQQVRQRQVVQRLPAGEKIGLVPGDMGADRPALWLEMQVDRRREAAIERQDRARGECRGR